MNPADIRTAIVDTFKAANLPVNAYAYGPGGKSPPFILIRQADDYIEFHKTMGRAGVEVLRFRLEVHAGGPPEDAERLLDQLVTYGEDETKSIFEAFKADRTLGGVVQSVQLGTVAGAAESEYGWFTSITLDVYP